MFFKWWPFRNKKRVDARRDASGITSLEKVFTPTDQLVIGMYVAELDRPWIETDFLFQGFEIKNEKEIEKIRDLCSHVFIDQTKTKQRRKAIVNKSTENIGEIESYPSPPKKLGVFEKEIKRSEKLYEETGIIVNDFMERIARGEGVDTNLAKQAVSECVNSILHSPDAMLWLSQLKNKDEYTAQHSLNVCVLSIVLGRQIGLSEASLNNVGLCGMMHDMGKMLIPLEILNKPGRLEDEEMDIMKTHTTLGHELLKSSHGMYPGAVEVALLHHERLDGKGYPKQVGRSQLSHYTRIVTIADLYDAITSDRVYQKGRTHLEATKILSDISGTHLDQALVIKFIESIGVYPPGSFVELTNGAVGLVVEVSDTMKLRPKVLLILDEDKNSIPEVIVDLSEMPKDSLDQIYTIRKIIRPADFKIDASKYYQEGVLQKGFALGKMK